jgi:hypothetical protein
MEPDLRADAERRAKVMTLSCTGLLKKHRKIEGISTVCYCTKNEGSPLEATVEIDFNRART